MGKQGRSRRLFHTIAALAMCCFMMPVEFGSAQSSPVRLEAETGTMYGHAKVVSSGDRTWVEGFQKAGDRVELTVHIDYAEENTIPKICSAA